MPAVVLHHDVQGPIFWTPDGLEVIGHVIEAGCRRAVAFDASGTTTVTRRVGSCDERWFGAIDGERGWFERDGELFSGAFGSRKADVEGALQCELVAVAPDVGRWLERCDDEWVIRGGESRQSESIAKMTSDGTVATADQAPFGTIFDFGEHSIAHAGEVDAWYPTPSGLVVQSGDALTIVDSLGSEPIVEGRRATAAAASGERIALLDASGQLLILPIPTRTPAAHKETVWKGRVEWLSSPERKGRLTGSPQDEDVAAWIESELAKIGIEPLRSPFSFEQPIGSTLTLTIDGVNVTEGFRTLPTTDSHQFDGPVITLDDFDGSSGDAIIMPLPTMWIDAKGAHAQYGTSRDVPVFLESNDLSEISRPHAGMTWGDGPPVIITTTSLAGRLRDATNVSVRYSIESESADSASIYGVIPAEEDATTTVVVMAHADHIGEGGFSSLAPLAAVEHPGANDNASGVASLLELGERLASRPLRKTRVILLFTAGEERGFLGARRFATMEGAQFADEVSLVVNLDMVGRFESPRLFVSEDFPPRWLPLVDASSAAANWHLDELSPLEEKHSSDHMVFQKEWDVPVVFFHDSNRSAWHNDQDRPGSLESEAALRATHSLYLLLRSIDSTVGEVDRGDASSEEVGQGIRP